MSPYARFLAMIATSMLVMHGLTYVNSAEILGHAHFSQTRLYMTGLMGAAMAAVMLAFMGHMLTDRRRNAAILAGAALAFVLCLWLVRSQATVGDVAYMRAMIPHHSIAILTSTRAGIRDPRVRELADGITRAQRREIGEMEWLIDDIGRNGAVTDPATRPVPAMAAGG